MLRWRVNKPSWWLHYRFRYIHKQITQRYHNSFRYGVLFSAYSRRRDTTSTRTSYVTWFFKDTFYNWHWNTPYDLPRLPSLLQLLNLLQVMINRLLGKPAPDDFKWLKETLREVLVLVMPEILKLNIYSLVRGRKKAINTRFGLVSERMSIHQIWVY